MTKAIMAIRTTANIVVNSAIRKHFRDLHDSSRSYGSSMETFSIDTLVIVTLRGTGSNQMSWVLLAKFQFGFGPLLLWKAPARFVGCTSYGRTHSRSTTV